MKTFQHKIQKKIYLQTYGCQMNIYDSEKIIDILRPHGYSLTNNINEAQLIILNTCHIREKATEKIYSELGRLPKKVITIVAGCVAQAEGEEIIKRAPNVNIIVGSQSYHKLPLLLENLKRQHKWQIDLAFAPEKKFDLLKTNRKIAYTSFLTIQEGCDKFCHFCCVPYTRGAEYSRKTSDILQEAERQVKSGSKAIVLLGQNVSAWHNKIGLAQLLQQLLKISGLERLSYLTSHPRDMKDPMLFKIHAEQKKILPYLHLPVQSGSDKILRNMNRKHTRKEYFDIIKNFQKACSNMIFSSDFIVGYPGETENDFRDTLDLVNRIPFSKCYSFKYSPRPGTPSSTLHNQIPETIKNERLLRLQTLLREKQIDFNKSCVGRELSVLFEKKGKFTGQIIGKTPYLQNVIVHAKEKNIGEIKNIKITQGFFNHLEGYIK